MHANSYRRELQRFYNVGKSSTSYVLSCGLGGKSIGSLIDAVREYVSDL